MPGWGKGTTDVVPGRAFVGKNRCEDKDGIDYLEEVKPIAGEGLRVVWGKPGSRGGAFSAR